jgi:hypothetical protein
MVNHVIGCLLPFRAGGSGGQFDIEGIFIERGVGRAAQPAKIDHAVEKASTSTMKPYWWNL